MNSSQEGVSDGQCRMDILYPNFDIWKSSILENSACVFGLCPQLFHAKASENKCSNI